MQFRAAAQFSNTARPPLSQEKSPLFLKRFHDAVSQADMRMSLRKSTGSVLTGSGKKKELDIFATEVSQ